MSTILPVGVGILALVGLADSVYLTVLHVQSSQPQLIASACTIGAGRCERVLASGSSTILGVPTALLGGIYFAAVLAAVLYRIWAGEWPLPRVLPALFVAGLAFSGYLVYSMVAVIGELCPYCLAAHAANTAIVIGYVASRWWDKHLVAGHV